MATTSSPSSSPAPQRAWQSLCPNCGAPVGFASAASASAVCGYCQSTLLREGDALRRIGRCAELFEDHTPLQLGVQGRYQNVPFTLVGRLQYRYDGGTWNEWFALFESSDAPPRPAWLSEDNGAYVFAFDQPAPAEPLRLADLQPGTDCTVGQRVWSVASITSVRLHAAQGELPRPPRLDTEFLVADLRNDAGEVGTLDGADPKALQWSVGRSVTLDDLALSGLREGAAEQTLGARSLACPSCGSDLAPKLDSTRSLTCPSCHAVVDISQGAGADLAYFAQSNQGSDGQASEPLIPLGRTGTLALDGPALPWQVVGYMERCDLPEPGDDEPQTFWREYLLYHRTQGFAFLVDTEEGWSWVRPLTGAPKVAGKRAVWQSRRYQERWRYRAKVTWVLGEFYWRVEREDIAHVTDYSGPTGWQLSREQSGTEVVWSEGRNLGTEDIRKAFNLPDGPLTPPKRATSSGSRWIAWILLLLAIFLLVRACSHDECDTTRQTFGPNSAEHQACQKRHRSSLSNYTSSSSSGGSYGGYSSSGGGHK